MPLPASRRLLSLPAVAGERFRTRPGREIAADLNRLAATNYRLLSAVAR
jgi:hypothetical protein